MSVPSISVVIPTLNEEALIDRCLDRVTRQRGVAFELIVVDNGSTDTTVARARAHGCRVLYEPRLSVAAARQRGFMAACAPLIASTDADTRVPEDWLARLAASFVERPEQVGVYGPVYPDLPAPRLRRWAGEAFVGFLELNQRLSRPHFCGANFAVRAEAFAQVGGFRSRQTGQLYRRAEDVQLSLKLQALGPVRFLKDVAVHTSTRHLGDVQYLWDNTKTYWAVTWRGRER